MRILFRNSHSINSNGCSQKGIMQKCNKTHFRPIKMWESTKKYKSSYVLTPFS